MARVLIAEDNPESLYLLQQMLEADGHLVVATSNGAEALEQALHSPPDIIISDIMMPEMNGFRLCREVRNHPELKKLPFIFYTATFLAEEDRRLAMSLGASRFVAKPMESPQFARIIHEVLEQHRRGELPPPPPPTAASDALLAMYDTSLNRKLAETVEKLRAEHRALARSEERLKEAQEIAQIGHWELDLHSGTLSWSDQLYRLLRQKPQGSPASRQVLLEAVHPEDRQRVAEAQALALVQKGAYTLDYRLALAEGVLRFVHERCQTQFDEAGNPAYAVGTIQDVTEAKRAEQKLTASENRLRLVIESMPVGVWLADASGQLRYSNPVGQQIWEGGRLVGIEDYDQYQGWWAASGEPIAAEDWGMARAIRNGETSLNEEIEIQCFDGSRKTILHSALPLLDGEGTKLGAIVILQDMTERKRAEKALQESEARVRVLNAELEDRVADRTSALERANQELEAYSYSVSHDLRAPLRAISGFANVLLDDHAGELSAEARRLLGRITANSEQMGQLIDDLLAFAHMDRKLLHKERIDLGELVDHCRSMLQGEVNQRRVQFRCGPLPEVFGDRAMLQQALFNLLDNALKFTRTTPEAIIEIGTLEQPGETVYYIRDNGVGFDMRHRGKLFGVFQRLHRGEDFEGSGVGLAIVQRIIQRHGGRVWIEGALNKGTTVFFTL